MSQVNWSAKDIREARELNVLRPENDALPLWDRLDDYEDKDEDGIAHDARPTGAPLSSLRLVLLEPYERPHPGQTLHSEPDAYETEPEPKTETEPEPEPKTG
ncbi:hypothetical protein ACFY0R_11755 [Streptomyces sp. NPDC001633]|uniref:hypothetical protein n=1 Tax=Streptomyces sp. NPDC001633 TaxID=3364595 RepID=UPI0036761B63